MQRPSALIVDGPQRDGVEQDRKLGHPVERVRYFFGEACLPLGVLHPPEDQVVDQAQDARSDHHEEPTRDILRVMTGSLGDSG